MNWAIAIIGALLFGFGLSILNAALPYIVAGAIFLVIGWHRLYGGTL